MEIIKVHESEIALWCELWHVQEMALHTHFIRSMSNQYFKERYLKADLKEGYCIKVEGRIVGFFGVQHEQIDGHTALVFSDFIIDPKYRMKGYLKETIQCLLDGFFENIDLFIFFPINREAMITWKFALRPKIIQNINSWCIALNKRDKEVDVYLEVQEISQCKDLWLYSEEEYYCRKIVSHKQPMGEFIYREIVHNGKKGAEIVRLNSLEINRIEEALNIVSAYLYEEGYEYMLIKVHEVLMSILKSYLKRINT